MSSVTQRGATATSEPLRFTTPEPGKKREDYQDYDLSPPKLRETQQRAFAEAVRAINSDFKTFRVEWNDDNTKVIWKIKVGKNQEEDLPPDHCRILLFLYSRNFLKETNKTERTGTIREFLKKQRTIDLLLQVIRINGDNDLSGDESYRKHYINTCLTICRYFQQSGSVGFDPDMSSVTYYLRMQNSNSCFLQAACVVMSYILHTHNITMAPFDASRLIRHTFKDSELKQYLQRKGGDSVAILKTLDEKCFDGIPWHRVINISTPLALKRNIKKCNLFKEDIRENRCPVLVSRFEVPKNFKCSLPSQDLVDKYPELDGIASWEKLDSLPPGFTRFTTWNEPGKFIPMGKPTEDGSDGKEDILIQKWKDVLSNPKNESNGADDQTQNTDDTASVSEDIGTSSSETCRERPTAFATTSSFAELDNDWSDEYELTRLFDYDTDEDEDDGEEYGNYTVSDDQTVGEGYDSETRLHAMVLLGYREVEGSTYWLLQNSWKGPMQIIEVSTDFFAESGAFLYYIDKELRIPKTEQLSKTDFLQFLAFSPVAESSSLEQSDCENWRSSSISSLLEHSSVCDDCDLDRVLF